MEFSDMPKANKTPTTRRRVVVKNVTLVPPPHLRLPSVEVLGRFYSAASHAAHLFDHASVEAPANTPAKHDASIFHKQMDDRACALSDLILALPIYTLADAAVLAVHGFLESDPGENHVLETAFARIAVVVAKAAGLNLNDFGSADTHNLLKRYGAGVTL
jgi:hypothetical protein